ncbi:MAG: hypothetical protein KFW09_01610 [Oscillospiraceae bacterium]|nr:hypothetical protein [Oscillospiraceae bacterium]
MEKQIRQKIEISEKKYFDNKKHIEKEIDLVRGEGRDFNRRLDEIAECIRYNSDSEEMEISSIYRLIDQAKQDGELVVKKELSLLEYKLEENQIEYNDQLSDYEGELFSLRNNGGL